MANNETCIYLGEEEYQKILPQDQFYFHIIGDVVLYSDDVNIEKITNYSLNRQRTANLPIDLPSSFVYPP